MVVGEMMVAFKFDRNHFESVFGAPRREEEPGTYRKCRTCGGWHKRGLTPHNCREPEPPRNPDLATPQIAPPFHAFQTVGADPVIIGSRHAKREYMARHDLVEYDAGVKPEREPTEREAKQVFAKEIKRFAETDPLNIPPVDRIGETDTAGAGEVSLDGVEIADD